MPSRRSVLATGALAAGTAVAGCASITGPPGTAAAIRGNAPGVPAVESAPIVARSSARSGDHGCPEGLLRAETRVQEVAGDGEPRAFVAVTEYDVITGESGCSTGWGQTGVRVRHDWDAGGLSEDGVVSTTQSNVVPTAEASQARLENQHTTAHGEWAVHLTPPTKSTMSYVFASTFADPGSPADGTVLLATEAEASVRKGWLGGSATLRTETTLTYGGDAR